MYRWIIYSLIITAVVYLILSWFLGQRKQHPFPMAEKPRSRFRSKRRPSDSWVQVYETDSEEEAQAIQARLEEEEIECSLFEQGRKGIHGDTLKRIGIIVPRSALARAQSIVSRIPG